MVGMKTSMKISLVIFIALALLAGLVLLRLLRNEPIDVSVADTSRGPSFDVLVVKPRVNRPLFGILPTKLEEKLGGADPRFDNTSPGARIGSVGHDRLELRADGWDLLIEIDG